MGNDNIINCQDDKSEVVTIKEGEFKRVKNLDPSNNPIEMLFDEYDKVKMTVSNNDKSYYLRDDKNDIFYVFTADKDGQITSGSIISYNQDDPTNKGIESVDDKGRYILNQPMSFKGTEKEKKAIMDFIENRVHGISCGHKISFPPNVIQRALDVVETTMTLGAGYSNGAPNNKSEKEIQ